MEKDKLISALKKIGFKEHLGYYLKGSYKIFLEEDDFIECHKDFELLFKIKSVNLGTLLVVLQQYQIFHERYCYERVECIEETFDDDDSET